MRIFEDLFYDKVPLRHLKLKKLKPTQQNFNSDHFWHQQSTIISQLYPKMCRFGVISIKQCYEYSSDNLEFGRIPISFPIFMFSSLFLNVMSTRKIL